MSTAEKSLHTAGPAPSRRAGLLPTAAAGLAVVVLAALLWWRVAASPDGGPTAGALVGVLTLVLGLLALVGWRTAPRRSWRVVDIVVAAVLGVAMGLVFTVWNLGWAPVSGALAFFPPASALLVGVWLSAGVVGGLVVRKPGAALFVELVAAVVSALVGNQWGFATVWYGLLQGLGAEVVLAVLLYRQWGVVAAVEAGAGAGVVVGILDTTLYYPEFVLGWKVAYGAFAVVSGIVIAGLGGWALTRALARTGALAPLASGRGAERV
ncbi:ECF transporter S component [Quadrisphaera sp. KR29]|uniref:ECF transporter S component n=1 Tax=Quadrisphaera sp. KR29 TaxID=3461391 RepID=UPI0040451605